MFADADLAAARQAAFHSMGNSGQGFGLAAYAHTNDLRRAHRVAAALESGSVWINSSGLRIGAPFGGVKQSGFGSMGGRFGLEDFLRPKNVYIPWAELWCGAELASLRTPAPAGFGTPPATPGWPAPRCCGPPGRSRRRPPPAR